MTSAKQLKSNRENALKGGVKTEAGKAVVRLNAVSHGLLTQDVLLPGEDVSLPRLNIPNPPPWRLRKEVSSPVRIIAIRAGRTLCAMKPLSSARSIKPCMSWKDCRELERVRKSLRPLLLTWMPYMKRSIINFTKQTQFLTSMGRGKPLVCPGG